MISYARSIEDKFVLSENTEYNDKLNSIYGIPLVSYNEGYIVDFRDIDGTEDLATLAEANGISPEDISVSIYDYDLILNPALINESYNIIPKAISSFDNVYLSLESLFNEYLETGNNFILENIEYLDDQLLSLLEITKAEYIANKDKRALAQPNTKEQLQNLDKAGNPNRYIHRAATTRVKRQVSYDKETGQYKINGVPVTKQSLDHEVKVGNELGGLGKEYMQNIRTARKLMKKNKAKAAAKTVIAKSQQVQQKPNTQQQDNQQTSKDTSNSNSYTNTPRETEIKKNPVIPPQQNNDKKSKGINKLFDKGKNILDYAKNNKKKMALTGAGIVAGGLLAKKISSLIKLRNSYNAQYATATPQRKGLIRRMIERIKEMIYRLKMRLLGKGSRLSNKRLYYSK